MLNCSTSQAGRGRQEFWQILAIQTGFRLGKIHTHELNLCCMSESHELILP